MKILNINSWADAIHSIKNVGYFKKNYLNVKFNLYRREVCILMIYCILSLSLSLQCIARNHCWQSASPLETSASWTTMMTSPQHRSELVSKVCWCHLIDLCDCFGASFLRRRRGWLFMISSLYWFLILCQNWIFAHTHLINRVLSFSSHCTWPDVVVQWCSQGDLLAVAGMERTLLSADPSCPPMTRNAIVKFYNVCGEHIYTLDTPAQVPNAVAVTAFVLINPGKCL